MTSPTPRVPFAVSDPFYYRCICELGAFKIDGVYCRLIPLSRGLFATVDADDFEWLMQWPWWASTPGDDRRTYAKRTISCDPITGKKKHFYMHREILGLISGNPLLVDHIYPPCTLDNRRKNLRVATKKQNCFNLPMRKTNTSGIKGVHWDKARETYIASVKHEGRTLYIGSDDNPLVARELYRQAVLGLRGEFARF